MRTKGKLIKWNDDKAFGFIAPSGGGGDVFIHQSAFVNRKRTPQLNDVITFTIAQDKQGRYCANKATYTGEKLKIKQAQTISKFSIYLSITFLGLIVIALVSGHLPLKLFLAYFGISTLTFIVYALDKSKAQRGAWRTPESTLHLFALAGGWPGAAIAQQLLRHKSQKKAFRLVFWLTVMLNCGALIWLMSPDGIPVLSMFR